MAVFAPRAIGGVRSSYLRFCVARARRRRVVAELWIEPRVELAMHTYELAFLNGELVSKELGELNVKA